VQALRHVPQPLQPLQCLQDTLDEQELQRVQEGVKIGLIPVEEQPAAAEAGPSSVTMQPSSSNKRQALGLSQQQLDDLKAGN
jgi:hypothetical protein